MTQTSWLSDLLDAVVALDSDADNDLEQRRRRDRAIGRELQQSHGNPAAQLRGWVAQQRQSLRLSGGARGMQLYHLIGLLLTLAGLLGGWGLASAVLSYDGEQPINIVSALALLILPQILLLLLWLLSAVAGGLPGLRNLGTTLGLLNPGRLAGYIAARFGAADNENRNSSLSMLWGVDNAALLAPVARWLFSFWSQLFALSFNVGALLCAFFLVTSSDLAFVWSTTLSISDHSFHQLVNTLAAPWGSLLPSAAPSQELVATSRYYRLEEGSLVGTAAIPLLSVALGQWWQFLLAALICYGLLPRLLTLCFSWYRLQVQLRKALCNLPGAPELLARMNSPLVSTSAAQPEQALEVPAADVQQKAAETHEVVAGPVIDWSGACNDQQAVETALVGLGVQVQAFLRAGGKQSPQQDRELVKSLCRSNTDTIAVVVKSWEPPLLDIVDFLAALRAQCPARTALLVLLLGDGSAVTPTDLETWQCTLAQLGDAQLHIECLEQLS